MNQIQIALDNGLTTRQALVLIKLAEIERNGGLNPAIKQITAWCGLIDANPLITDMSNNDLIFKDKQMFDITRIYPTEKGSKLGRKLTHFPENNLKPSE